LQSFPFQGFNPYRAGGDIFVTFGAFSLLEPQLSIPRMRERGKFWGAPPPRVLYYSFLLFIYDLLSMGEILRNVR